MLYIVDDNNVWSRNQKKSFDNIALELFKVKKLHKQVVYRPITCKPGTKSHFASLARVLTSLRQGYRREKMSFCILVGIYRHNIPTCTLKVGTTGSQG